MLVIGNQLLVSLALMLLYGDRCGNLKNLAKYFSSKNYLLLINVSIMA